jgi:hypothetical protein
MADPAKILDAKGVNVSDGISIRVVEDTEQVRTLIIPPAPSHLDDDQLKGIAGGRLTVVEETQTTFVTYGLGSNWLHL